MLFRSQDLSNTIGTMVMEGLKDLDPVAYVRFASVYRNFREEKDFVCVEQDLLLLKEYNLEK